MYMTRDRVIEGWSVLPQAVLFVSKTTCML